MAKVTSVTEETAALIQKKVEETSLFHMAHIEPLAVSKQSVMVKVAKANAATEFKCGIDDMVFLYIYESAFEKLSEEQQEIIIEDALNQILCDMDSGKISVVQSQLTMTEGGYAKYGQKMIDCAVAAHTTIVQMAEEEKAQKEAQKAAKKGASINELID